LGQALLTKLLKPTNDGGVLLEKNLHEVSAAFVTAIYRRENASGECKRLRTLFWLPAGSGIR
jgi:hypothetical protein